MTQNELVLELQDKFGEWLEVAGENSPALMIHILSTLLIKEREQTSYLKRRLDHVCANSTK